MNGDEAAGANEQLSRIDALERLGRLRDQGLLTEEEFVREKARILAAAVPSQPASSASDAPTTTTTAKSPAGRTAPTPDDNDLLAPIRPIPDDQYARFLVTKVWAGVAALIGGEVISVVARVFQLLEGRGWGASVSVPAGLSVSAGYLLLAGLILWGLGKWVSRHASRIGAVVLILLGVGALTTSVLLPAAGGPWLKVGGVLLSAFALWFLLGAARGAFALGGRPASAQPAQVKPSVREAWSQGRKASAPIRKVIGWVALGWLGLFLIGGVWFWWSTRSDGPMPPQPAAMASRVTASSYPPPTPAVTPAPALAPTRQMLIGVWSTDARMCVGWSAYELRADGQATTEGADGQWSLTQSTLIMPMRTYDMDTDIPGPVQDHGGFVEMVSINEFRLMQGSEVTTYYRCSSTG
jgi:hypothetical protein